MPEFGHLIVQVSYFVNACLGISYIIGKLNFQRILGLLFLLVAFIRYQFELIYTKELFYKPFFFLSYVPAIVWFGPLLLVVLQTHVFKQPFTKLDALKHFFIPVLVSFALIPIFIVKSDLKLAMINSLYYSTTTFQYLFLSVLCVGSLLFYIIILFNYLPSIKRMQSKKSFSYILFAILVLGIIFSGISFASQLSHSLQLLFLGNVIFSCLLIICYLLHLRFDFFINELLEEIRATKERQSYLTSINISKALGNLNHVIHEEKIYRNPELTLTGLANRLDLTPHQLSELLNNEIGKNFNSYITDFRIEDAIEELKKNKYSTILSIALSVGFNSNSAFYSAFKKVTGKSPSDYREQ